MLHNLKDLRGDKIARDGEIGSVDQVYFDDELRMRRDEVDRACPAV